MNSSLIALFSICSYSASTLLLAKYFYQQKARYTLLYPACLGLCGHLTYIALAFLSMQRFSFSFFNTTSMISALVVLLLLLVSLNKPIEKLGLIIFPVAAIMLGLDVAFPEKLHSLQNYNWQMTAHITSSILAFSLLNIAALQAILLAIQEQQLRQHPPRKFILSLPALQTMESLLFQMISLGLFFLSVSLITGIVFIDDLFTQHLVHKTILSIIAWLIFSALLLGRINYGWRGQTAVRCTIAGFILLLLAYFGSKLVLEIILERT